MIQKTYQHIAAAALLLLLFAGSVQAQTVSAPRMLSYQGVLSSTGTAGNDTAGNRLLKVTLYGDANGTTKLWQSTMNTPVDANGVFNCMLGSVDNPLPPPTVMDRAIWLGVSIDNAPELRPLSEVSASAYAINVADSSITTAKIAEGAVTWDKMGTDYVPYIRVNGDKVTTGHNSINFTGSEGMMVDYDSTTMSLIFHPDTALLAGTGGKGGMQVLAHNGGSSADYWGEELNTLSGTGPQNPNEWFGSSNDFEVRMYTNNTIALRLIPSSGVPNIVGGDASNGIGSTSAQGVFIGGGYLNGTGMDFATIGGGEYNSGDSKYGFIGGGANNKAGLDVDDSFCVVVGGDSNQANEEWSSIVGGAKNTIQSQYCFIGGGDSNYVADEDGAQTQSHFSSIVGGRDNTIAGLYGFIGGGHNNSVYTLLTTGDYLYSSIVGGLGNLVQGVHCEYGFIGGGLGNRIYSPKAAISSGDSNRILNGGLRSFIGAGYYNSINANSGVIAGGDINQIDTLAHHSAIGGGYFNEIQGPYGTIAGGDSNQINPYGSPSLHDDIGGGVSNEIYGVSNAAIGGGDSNKIGSNTGDLGDYSFIGSGFYNSITSNYDVVTGGDSNAISASWYSIIGGGDTNRISGAAKSAIGGGERNLITTPTRAIVTVDHSFIGGGHDNQIYSGYSTIAGGDSNLISLYASSIADSPFYSDHSFIGGGAKNEIRSEWNVIGGGQNNLIDVDTFGSKWSVIGGGRYNYDGPGGEYNIVVGGDSNLNNGGVSFMGGGQGNQVYNELGWATLGGGDWNFIGNIVTNSGPNYASLLGGRSDSLAADYGAIGGGQNNTITSAADHAVIPGGDSLIANSYAQTVVGYNNLETVTAVTKAQAVAGVAGAALDNSLLIVGNGTKATHRANAFTVSYDGHTSAYDVNGSGVTRAAYVGSTYEDNTIVAWANVPAAIGAPSPHTPVTPTEDFGVASINYTAAGQFDVTLNVKNPDNSAHTLSGASITVTVEDGSPSSSSNCVFATSTGIGAGNTFTIHLHDTSCGTPNVAFMFKVVGR